MHQRLLLIASKYGISEAALGEIEGLIADLRPRIPTEALEGGPGEGDAREGGARTPPPPGRLDEDTNRYEDVQGIGRGGFGEVREVMDLHVGRLVARKVQLPEKNSLADCERFRREVRMMARLQHLGVVPLHDWGELADGRIWFTMKRVRGQTIATRINALHRLEGPDFLQALRRLLDDFRRLCEPVAYAHMQRIIHRDITPENLMIGELGEVHVMDWGLARDLVADAELIAPSSLKQAPDLDPSERMILTRPIGTRYYMPPEQARGELSAMGPASDVYSLGAILYEILTGRAPYMPSPGEAEPRGRPVDSVLAGPPRPVEEIARREIPKELFALCSRAMQREPPDRYPDAGALMEAIRDWLDGADRLERASRIVAEANREHLERIREMRADAERRRARSREILDKLRGFDRTQEKAEAWQLADDAEAIEQRALREEIYWTQRLRSALNEAPDLEEAHRALVDHYAASLVRAEDDHNMAAATGFAALMEDHMRRLRDAGLRAHYEELLRGDGRLTLLTEPANAEVVIKTYRLVFRYLMNNEEGAHVVRTPLHEHRMERGSYLLIVTAPGRRAARYPVLIGRNTHWDSVRPGRMSSEPLRLLPDEELGPDDIYVPAGRFVAGGDPHAGESLPQRRIWVDSFVIRRYPVTNAEYVDFLNALAEEGLAADARRFCPRGHPGATMDDEAELAYFFNEESGRYALRNPESEAALPVVFVDWRSAMAYAAHRARRTGLPWRLPSEFEWEKAARGTDGRFMPWGDQIEPTWACVSGAHRERKRLMPVDSYPTDVSPYGARGMAGNARDWCIDRWSLDGPRVEDGILKIEPAADDDDGYRAIRGGAWSSVGDMARLAIRYAEEPWKRHGLLSFRLARSCAP